MNPFEVSANAVNAVSVVLAARNSVHTWWTGILGCTLFAWVYFQTQLYADVTLQAFFVVTCFLGWRTWLRGSGQGDERPIRSTPAPRLFAFAALGVVSALAYGALLHRFTDAYAPFLDSVVLAASVLGQLLLMGRRVETWWFWLLADTVAVPLFASRGLYLTACLYACFWVNAIFGLRHWRREMEQA